MWVRGSPDTFTYVLNGGDSATVSITVDCTPNTAPVADDDTATIGENAGPTVVPVLVGDTDADGDTLVVSATDTTGTTGVVTNNGTDVSYNPNGAFEFLGAGQTATDSFTYTVSDGNGGTDDATVTITVTGVNDAPVIAAIESAPLAYTENAAATPITATGTVADVDSANLATGTLTVDFSAGGLAEDRLAVAGGTTIGTVSGGTNGTTPLVITLNTTATPAAVQALLRSVTYANVSNNPSTAARTVRFVLTDGDGGTSNAPTRQVNVSAANDAPVIAAIESAPLAYTENAAATPITATGTVADADSVDLAAGTLTVSFTAGGAAEDRLAVAGGTTIGTIVGGTNGSTPLVITLNATATPAAVQALLRSVTYANVSNNPSTAARTVRFVLTDGDGGTSAPVTRGITVTAVNDLPVAVNDAATVAENTGPTVVTVLGNDTDADGDTLAVSGLGVGSTLGLVTNNGTDVSYNPNGAFEALGAGQTATDTFTYTVSDGNGGTDTAAVTITITGANDAPVIAAIEAGALSYTENAAATPITATGTVADVDSANLATGTLTVSFTAGGAAEDRLAVAGGTTIGTVVGGTNGTTPLVITLNATATPAAVQALLRSVTYANVSNNPSTAARTVRFVLTDGDGGTSNAATRGIAVTAIDDAPVAVNDTATMSQDAPATAVPVLTNDTDVDGGPKTISSASDPANGQVILTGGSVGAHTGLTYEPDPGYCNTGGSPDTFTYVLNGGDSATVSITVTCAVNGAPVIAAVETTPLAVTENDPYAPITATGTVTDSDSPNFATGTLTVDFSVGTQPADQLGIRNEGLAAGQIGVSGSNVTYGGTTIGTFAGGVFDALVVNLNASATPAAVQALLRNVTYRSLSDAPAPSRTVRFVLTDGDGGTSNAATRAITVAPENDPPVLLMGDPTPLVYDAGDPATVITPNSSVNDPDSANFDTGSLFVDFLSGGQAEDRLEILNQGTGAGQIGVSGANVTYGGTTIGTFSGGSGLTPLVVTFNANVTPPVAQAVLRVITYRNVAASPVTTNRSVRFIMADGGGGLTGTSGPVFRTITVSAPAAPPVVTTSAGTTAYTENGAALVVDGAVTVTDTDNANLAGATVQITGGLVSAQDTLSLTPPSGITVGYDAATGKLTLSGNALVATYQTALRGVRYSNSSENPATANRTVTFVANDGTAPSNSATKTVSVAAVNDPPLVGLEGAVLAYTENAAATPITVTGPLTDPDSANFAGGTYTADFSVGGQAEDRLAIRNQGVAAGQIGVSGANVTYGGTTIGTFAGGNPGTTPLVVTLNASATPTAVQALHRNVTYANASNNPVTASRTVRVVVSDGDGGTSGAGIRTITVASVNDAPAVSVFEAAALAYTENAAATPITATVTVTDVDSADFATGTLTVDFSAGGLAEDRLAVAGGTTIGTVVGGTNGTTPLVITLNATATPAAVQALLRSITYANVSESPSTAARTVRAVVTDGDGGTSATRTRTINVTAVEDAPVVTASAGTTPYTEQAAATVVDPGLTATDLDAGNVTGATVTVVSALAGDTLHFTTQGTITGVFASNVLTLSGTATLAQYQAALRTVQFSNASNNAPGATRVIGFRITAPVASNTSNKTIAITQVNDPSVVNLDGAGGLPYAEQAGSVNAFGPAATVVDPDSATLASLSVTVSAGFDASFDTVRLNPTITGFTPTFTGGVLTLTRAGGTVAEYQNALRNVQFGNTDNDPDHRNDGTPNALDASRTLSVVVNDGTLTSSPVTRVVTIAPINDAPAAPSVLPTVAGVRNTTLVSGVTTPEPHVVRSAVPFVGNAVDPDNLESAISVVPVDSVTTSSGGIIGLLANGSLRYEPPASGTLASDTYAYTLTDGTSPSAPITFTISLSGAIWYVADQAIVGANGTAVRPFATVAAALAAAPAGQPVHIRRSFGDGILSGAIVLGAGDKLLGEGVALTNVEVGTATVETLFPATGTRPVLTASGVDVVTLASNTTVAGVSINADGAANGVFGNATAGVTLRSMDVNDTGAAATQPAIETTGVGNGLTFTSPVSLITTSAGALTLAGTALAGTVSVQVSGSTSGPGISLTNTTGSLTFSSANITATGQSAIVLSSAGTVLFPAASNVSAVSNGAKALDVISTNLGSSVFDLVTSIASTTGGVRFNSVSGTPTLGDGVGTDVSLDITSGSTPAFDIASSNTVTVDAAGTDVIVAVGGPAVDIRNSLGSTYGFDSVSSTNSAGDGINLDTNVGTLFSATGGVISGASGIGLDVNGGGAAGDVTVNTRIENGPGPLSVEVTGRDGGVVTVSGDISDGADVGGGIAVTDNSGGAVNFTGATKVVNTGTSNGVVLTSNNAATSTNFTGGGLNALAGAGSGFLASGGGTVTVTGAGNVISTLAGTALSITSTTIGAADLTFQNISANGAPSGIVLNNTGTVGNLNVTGTGAAPTGGQILNTTGPGVSLTDTDGASFNNLRIAGTNRSGVQGVGVTGFSFTNGIILGAGDSAVDDNDSSIAFNTTTGGQNNNVDGVVTITGNQFSQAYGGGIDIFNYAGTITNANISNNQVSSLTDPAVSRRSGIALNLFGSTTTVASLTTATISGNTVTGFPSGDGISIQGANTASASAPAGTYGTPGGAPVTITGNFVIGDPTNKINGFGISASVTGRGQGNFVITNNGSAGSPLQYMKSSAIAIGAAGDVTAYFTVTGNRISANNGFGSSGIALGVDKNIQADLSTLANAVVRATITGNTVANTSGGGLRVLNHDTNGSLDLRVENNTITNVLGPNAGISIENGSSGNVAYNPTMCASVANNNVANGPADGFGDQDPGIALRKGSTSATTYKFGLVGLAPSPATALQTEAYVTGLNPLSAVGAGFYAGKRVYATGSNYTSCTLPPGV
ncbi:hypothetical protein ASD81_11110 [Nocardioides sp. Root614]|nr:hypothetical protein ASD81_11110 [Nocardioides sp. Root614]